jgi:hypothetical protein
MAVIAKEHTTAAPTDNKRGAQTRGAPASNYDIVQNHPQSSQLAVNEVAAVFTIIRERSAAVFSRLSIESTGSTFAA